VYLSIAYPKEEAQQYGFPLMHGRYLEMAIATNKQHHIRYAFTASLANTCRSFSVSLFCRNIKSNKINA